MDEAVLHPRRGEGGVYGVIDEEACTQSVSGHPVARAQQLTGRQDAKKNHHVNTNNHPPRLRRRNLRQVKRRHDRQAPRPEPRPQPREEDQAQDPRREDLHEGTGGPEQHEELPAAQAAEAVRDGEGEDGAEGGAEDAEGGDVGAAGGEGGGVVRPVRGIEVEIVFE